MTTQRNNLEIYNDVAADWWSDEICWVRTLKNLAPGRLRWFYKKTRWEGKTVLDLGCAGGFVAEALSHKGAQVTGIDPAQSAIEAVKSHAKSSSLDITYDVGLDEQMPYADDTFDIVVCVDILEHVRDLSKVLAEVARVLKPGGLFLYDTINRNPIARLATITIAEDILHLLPKGTHDPAMFIKPNELRAAMTNAGLTCGPQTGLAPRGVNCRFDITFGPLLFKTVIYMGMARLLEVVACRQSPC